MSHQQAIRIGTLVPGTGTVDYVRQILPHGFESFEITWGFGKTCIPIDMPKLASDLRQVMGDRARIAALGVFGNPLGTDEEAAEIRSQWEKVIDNAHEFGTDVVAGFAGADPTKPIHDNIERFKQVWGPLAERAKAKRVRIAFENCPMGGDWNRPRYNIAVNPDAWELMFAAVPLDNLGLEWEPCHQLCQLIDAMPQLRQWAKRVFHVHGKDASVYRDLIARHGIGSPVTWCHHRTPGFGDTNWADVISELRKVGFVGSIDIEGWHDPVYRGELEMTGQVAALNYLKACRGGSYVANPTEQKAASGY
ncbi:MAG: sugar phosphate isomerase/epimerase [Planctomycetes bacterium]|nr:sugar phosphate isomerase/epimerase [Planctomycetota bacterium]